MRVDESIEIEADDIPAAARDILDFLEDTSKEKEIYFKGWDGFGASATLKTVTKMLRSAESMKNPKLKFDRVIHIDCSLWKSRRALQKAIALELKLPNPVMAIFYKKDRDDDFKGVGEAARREIDDVTKEIFMNLAGRRFVVIFHNGGHEYIDFFEFGVPIYGHLRSKVLWTFHGRFRPHVQVDDEVKETIEKRTDAFLRAVATDRSDDHESTVLSIAVQEEATEVARYLTTSKDPAMVLECILYMWAHRHVGGIDWGAHAPSYWVSDGIIRVGDEGYPEFLLKEKMWEIADDLHGNIHLDWDLDYVSRAVPKFIWLIPRERWVRILLSELVPQHTTGCQQSSHSFHSIVENKGVRPKATSFFIASSRDKPSTQQAATIIDAARLPSHMLKHFESLRVIQLSWCTFIFSAPPFLYCENLKFLGLDHCKDLGTSALSDGGEVNDQTTHDGTGIWVLHLNHTNINLLWYTGPPMKPRELYFSGVTNWIEHHLHAVQLGELGKLGVTTDPMETFPNLLQAKSLRTIFLDGCTELKEVGPDILPLSLEAFTFFVESSTANKGTPTKGEGEGGAKVHTISLRCCTQLKGLFLRGWFKKLGMLDLSGTLLKTLDLSMVEAPFLRGLCLLGCRMLCAILWPPASPRLQELQIDTTTSQLTPSMQGEGHQASWTLNISMRDARLLDSLVPIGDHFVGMGLRVDISSPGHAASCYAASSIDDGDDSVIIATSGCSISKKHMLAGRWLSQLYANKDVVSFDHQLLQLHHGGASVESGDNASATTWMWDCPRAPLYYRGARAYIRVEDRTQEELLGPGQGTELLCDHAKDPACARLRVHHQDPVPSGLELAQVVLVPSRAAPAAGHRVLCYKVTTFYTPEGEGVGGGSHQAMFWYIQTLWASQLPVARHVWSWSVAVQPDERSFEDLEYVHLDNCPRLLHVLPLSMSVNLRKLHTLEIVCCDSLVEVFPVPAKREVVNFWSLRRLHLHELPALRCLSGRRMSAPILKTVKVRGCWSLSRMPAVEGGGVRERKPTVDCEKEWWDRLVWDGVQLDHDPNLYRTRHPRYGKEAGLRPGTLLR
ncbi:unnamed protein product [Urochloa decumbens]|uniref:Disease resistance protein At4g27190-like leucine-rich repeats domain-containing protein n=1 Tax=Urochloa decumbens TaxID=240449 RepID=A0ABC8W9B8_9POAL